MSPSVFIAVFSVFAISTRFHHGSVDEESLVLLQQHAQPAAKTPMADGVSGSTVPISEKGYKMVAVLKNDWEMTCFIRRVVEAEGRVVSSRTDLDGMAPYYSGTTAVRSLAEMKKELREASWVADGEGRIAPLTEEGYQKVASLGSRVHMLVFIRRFIDASNMMVVDQDGLKGLVPYYDGEISVQNLERLSQEVTSAPWVWQHGAKKLGSVDGNVAALAESRGSAVKLGLVERIAFDKFDHDKDGFISRAELKGAMSKKDEEFPEDGTAKLMVDIDSDGDDQISLAEFTHGGVVQLWR